ncbi:MAG: sugar phosphate isomerase/epimerase [Bauldia sp.]|nr:sugar phosphate isomerase/epimerase [Bauldia sp.]
MKIGFCKLLWATHVTGKHAGILKDLKQTGYDGAEIPVFEGKPKDYAEIGRMLDDIGLERTSITVIPDLARNPVSADKKVRQAAIDYLKWCIDCSAALGSSQLAGPLMQTLGHFSGKAPTDSEWRRAAGVHRKVGNHAADHGLMVALEAVNRFEIYFANTMDDLGRYVRLVDHPNVKAMYDTFHANIEETDPVAAYKRNARDVVYVHISENDRGVPGRGHVPWKETFAALKQAKYDGWLTIEAFGRGLPELAAATRVWRDFAESPEAVYRDGYKFIRRSWDAA